MRWRGRRSPCTRARSASAASAGTPPTARGSPSFSASTASKPRNLGAVTVDRASADKLLTTTRSVRKRLDLTRPVPAQLIRECIEIATQAPTGSNAQEWGFVVVTDPAKRQAIADYYRK